ILIGAGVIGLPEIAVRAMAFTDSRAMHRAILIGHIVVGIIMVGMHLVGVFARAVLQGIDVAAQVIELVALVVLHPWVAGSLRTGSSYSTRCLRRAPTMVSWGITGSTDGSYYVDSRFFAYFSEFHCRERCIFKLQQTESIRKRN